MGAVQSRDTTGGTGTNYVRNQHTGGSSEGVNDLFEDILGKGDNQYGAITSRILNVSEENKALGAGSDVMKYSAENADRNLKLMLSKLGSGVRLKTLDKAIDYQTHVFDKKAQMQQHMFDEGLTYQKAKDTRTFDLQEKVYDGNLALENKKVGLLNDQYNSSLSSSYALETAKLNSKNAVTNALLGNKGNTKLRTDLFYSLEEREGINQGIIRSRGDKAPPTLKELDELDNKTNKTINQISANKTHNYG